MLRPAKTARSKKQETAPGLKYSSVYFAQNTHCFQNWLSVFARQWISFIWALVCHVILSNLNLNVAKSVLFSPFLLFPILHLISIFCPPKPVSSFGSPYSAQSLSSHSNSHLMPCSTPVFLPSSVFEFSRSPPLLPGTSRRNRGSNFNTGVGFAALLPWAWQSNGLLSAGHHRQSSAEPPLYPTGTFSP